jgi:hypothetical protein
MQIRTLLSKYVCDSCKRDCTRSQLGAIVHWQDVKPLISQEAVSVTKHFCNNCSEKRKIKLGV